MPRKLFLPLLWFPSSLILLICNFLILQHIDDSLRGEQYATILSPLGDITSYQIAAGEEIANTSKVLGTRIIAGDARGKLLTNFLEDYDSPMAPFAEHIVDEADKNGIDYRLVVAIAMCESNLGKRIPPNSFNAWGIAVYTGQQHGAVFQDWGQAISWVSRYIKERYIDRGFTTLREIGAVYAPPSVHTGHSWSRCVEEFQTSIY